jgi:hypothetical protein
MPAFALDREYVCAEAVPQIAEKGMTFPVACPRARGDRFIYSDGVVK